MTSLFTVVYWKFSVIIEALLKQGQKPSSAVKYGTTVQDVRDTYVVPMLLLAIAQILHATLPTLMLNFI